MPTPIPAGAFRGHHAGVLLVGERGRPVRFVHENDSGAPILPIDSGELEAGHATLCCPDEHPMAMQLLADIIEIEDWRASEPCDRWQGRFGRPDRARWARLKVDSVRWGGGVIRAEDVVVRNLLAGVPEARLCKAANAHKAALARLVQKPGGVDPADMVMVGVDQFGFDIRAGMHLLRVDFGEPVREASSAAAALSHHLGVAISA